MAKKLFLFFSLLLFLSCSNKTEESIYKTKSGEFASKTGNFIADFPTKPGYTVIDNQVGLDKFKFYLFRSTLGPNKYFSVEYADYPEYMIKSMTDEQVYSQGVTNYSNKMAEAFVLDFQESISQHGLNGHYFVLQLNQKGKEKGINGHIEGKLFRKGNRVYTVTYLGRNDKNTDKFMESFRLINDL